MSLNRGYRRGLVGGTVGALAVAISLIIPASQVQAAGRQITDLGTLGGATAFARDINEPGQIVGESATAGGQTHAFLITPWVGRMVDLGTLGGTFSQALAISNRGQVVGTSTLSGDDRTRAFLYDQGKMTALPPLNGAMFSEARDVNDAGTVVGQSNGVAVLWQNGRVRSLGMLGGGSSFATGINPSGVIVGTGSIPSGDFHGWVFKNGVMTDLGGFGGANSSAEGINSAGDKTAGKISPTRCGFRVPFCSGVSNIMSLNLHSSRIVVKPQSRVNALFLVIKCKHRDRSPVSPCEEEAQAVEILTVSARITPCK